MLSEEVQLPPDLPDRPMATIERSPLKIQLKLLITFTKNYLNLVAINILTKQHRRALMIRLDSVAIQPRIFEADILEKV